MVEGSRQNPYLFVVGCPRSGTTLLQRMLDCHPQLAVANDSHFIPRAIEGVTVGIDPRLTPELVEWVRTYRRFYRLGLSQAAVDEAAANARTYGEFVTALYSEYGRQRGKPLAGEKTPDYVRHLPRLHALFPWVRTIHIIRDGRDVALSTLEWAREDKGPGKLALWQKEPLAVCALWWRWQVGSGLRDAKALSPSQYCEVRYEDLVVRPDEALRGLVTFLSLPFAPDMLTYYEGKTRDEPGLSSKKAWLPPTPGLRDWRTQMVERDVELFEALAGDLLSALGYERATRATSPEIAALAERCRRWWESERPAQPTNIDPGPGPGLQAPGGAAFSGRLEHATVHPPKENSLGPADADLARRDPALPGLAVVLDPDALVAALRWSLPTADLGAARSTYVRYKPGTNCLVAYQLEVAGAELDIYATACRPDDLGKFRKADNRFLVPALGPGQIVLDDHAVVVCAFPNDRKLKSLARLVNDEARSRLLRKLLGNQPDLWQGTVRTLRYKPERRYVGQVLGQNGARAALKVYTQPDYNPAQRRAKVLGLHTALGSTGVLRIPRRLGRSARHCIVATEWLPGRLLSEAIADPVPNLMAVTAVGSALAELHSRRPDKLEPLTRAAEVAALLGVAGGVGVLRPHLAEQADDLARRIAAQFMQAPSVNCLIHGDFYAKQVLVGDDGVSILDLDEAVRGDPAADLGNFIAHLHSDALRGNLAPGLVDPVRDALLAGYPLAGHPPFFERIQLYTASGLFRLAHDPFRHRESEWPERTRAVLDRVEAILGTISGHRT